MYGSSDGSIVGFYEDPRAPTSILGVFTVRAKTLSSGSPGGVYPGIVPLDILDGSVEPTGRAPARGITSRQGGGQVVMKVAVQQRQRLFREGLGQLLQAEDDLDMVGIAGTSV